MLAAAARFSSIRKASSSARVRSESMTALLNCKGRRVKPRCAPAGAQPNGPMTRARASFVKEIGWRLEVAGFDAFCALLRLLPTDWASAAGAALFRSLGPFTRAHRTAELGLVLAFPDMAPAERTRLLAEQWDNFGRYIFEFPLTHRLTPAGGRVEVVARERLAAIAASGAPAILISGHFSNLEVM